MGKTFVSVVGQQDNLGDSVLRRGLLDTLRESSELHVYVGRSSHYYVSGLRLQPGDKVYRHRGYWFGSAIANALFSRASYAFNPGEVRIAPDSRYVGFLTWATLVAVRAGGGVSIHTGVGVRAPKGVIPAPERRALEKCDFVTWRDAESQEFAGFGDVAPDWAFALGGEGAATAERSLLAITVRGDRPMPLDSWFDEITELANRVLAEPIVVTQVERDARMSEAVASRLGCRTVPWVDDHALLEAQMRDVYAQSIAVVSDRLHALIIAFTEGAVPLGYTTNSIEKLRRTLAPAGIPVDAENLGDLYREAVSGIQGSRELVRARMSAQQQSMRVLLA